VGPIREVLALSQRVVVQPWRNFCLAPTMREPETVAL
jgi:hypothetical protein